MKEYSITEKGLQLLKESYQDQKELYKNGNSIEEIAKIYSVPVEWIRKIIKSNSLKELFIYNYSKWEENYIKSLLKRGLTSKEIKTDKYFPVNEKYFDKEHFLSFIDEIEKEVNECQ